MAIDEEWAAARREIQSSAYWVGPDGRRPRWKKRIFDLALKTFTVGLRLALLEGRGQRNALRLRLRQHEIVVPRLPAAFDGYRLLHVSDSHLDVFPALVDRARDLVAGLEVDLLVFTGDALGHLYSPVDHAADLLAAALEGVRVRDRRLAVLGNHDPIEMVGELERIGFEVLVNRTLELARGEERISVTGLDDVHHFYTPRALAALAEETGRCTIALVHSPELADHAARAGYDLYLSGHTHGGQIAWPGGRPVITQLTRCRHAAVGLWSHDDLRGHTSSGLGVSPPGVRFNTQGEMALLTLRRAA